MKNVEDIYPVSPMQELMLLHALSRPATDTLFNQFQFDVDGVFDLRAFENAWQTIIDRHDVLRTAFIWQDVKQPLQVVRKSVSAEFCIKDLREQDTKTQRARVDEYLRNDRQTGLDLKRAPLMRFCLLRLDEACWRFIWTCHHLVVDRWCLGQIYEEIDRYYAQSLKSNANGEHSRAPGFKQYIEWLSRQDKAATVAYWAGVLDGYRSTTSLLAADSDSVSASTENARCAKLEIDTSIAAAVDNFARANALTIGILAQAAWALTLNHLLRSQDVVFDVTVSGRPADIPDVESIIGTFINNVPVRNRLVASMPVTQWLRNLQSEQFARSRHEYLSNAELKAHIAVGRPNAEFESLLVCLAEVGGTREIDMRPVSADYTTAYPLTISILQTHDGMRVRAESASRCAWDLRDILKLFEDALRALAQAEADAKLEDLAIFRAEQGFSGATSTDGKIDAAGRRLPLTSQQPVADVADGRERLGTDVLRELVEAEWASVFGQQDFSGNDDFFAMGGTSLQAAALHTRLETATRQSIPILALFGCPTIDGMVRTIFEKDWPLRMDIVNTVRIGTDRAPLFCIASPEVNTVGYSLLARHLDTDQGLYVLQSPPADNLMRRVQPSALPELASRYLQSMRRIQSRGPYRMLGMCTGSHIALEMARQLTAEKQQVEFLGIINTWGLYTVSRLYYVNRLMNIARYYVKRIRELVPVPSLRRAAYAVDLRRSISNQADIVDAESMEGYGSAWIQDVGFASRNPGLPKLATTASVFRLKSQPFWRIRDASLGWSMHVKEVDVVTILGVSHHDILRESHISEVATAVNARLRRLNDE